MKMSLTKIASLALLAGPLACYADSSYEHTTQITGGQLINTLKNIPFVGRQMKKLSEPMSEITMVHGNQKAIVSKDYTEIWDLDKEEITHIDNVKKTYSVITFADMRKMLAELPAKMQEMQDKMKQAQSQQKTPPPNTLKYDFTTDVKDTGQTQMVDKYNTRQQIMTMKMTVTDTRDPQTNIAYSMTTEIWTTPDVPAEMTEVQDFDKRFAAKLMQGTDTKEVMAQMQNLRTGGAAMMSTMFGAQPGAGDAFAQMGKEMAKIKGTRIIEITRMGGSGTGIQGQPDGQAGVAPSQSSGQSVAGQVATDTTRNTSQAAASNTASHVGGLGGVALGSAMSGALGGVFAHKKAKPAAPPPDTTTTSAAAPAQAAPGQVVTTDVTLMEMTTKTHDFSSETVPGSVFQVPAGFKQVESQMQQMMDKK
jgi:hypothetical protein